jgi:LacI family transcriptional regulator
MLKITIRDVAAKAGVSTGTVSRVLNNRDGVKDYTRKVVLQAMESLGYQPDEAARQLSLGNKVRIGLNVSPNAQRLNPFFFLFIESLMAKSTVDGYRFEEIFNLPNGLPARTSDGMVLFGAHDADPRISYLQDKGVPFVLLGHGAGFSSVSSDDFDGGYQAGKHLLTLGHRRILHIGGYMEHQAFQDRYQGFLAALKEFGLEHSSDLILDGGFSTLGAYRAVMKHLENKQNFTGIFASSDEMAIGASQALVDHGLDVPKDVSIVGFDDLPEIGVTLTTIHQDIPLLAETAIRLLTEQFQNKHPRHVTIPVQLIARRTTARVRL